MSTATDLTEVLPRTSPAPRPADEPAPGPPAPGDARLVLLIASLAIGLAAGSAAFVLGGRPLEIALLISVEGAIVMGLALRMILRGAAPTGVVVAGIVTLGLAIGVSPDGLGAIGVAAGIGGGLLLERRLATTPAGTLDLRQDPRARPDGEPISAEPSPRSLPVAAVLTALTGLALGLRLIAPRGLWLDELTSVYQARLSFRSMIDLLYSTDNHPPLHDIVMWLQIRLVGDSELALRLPSIVIGAATVPVLYLLGRELYGRRTGLIAAGLFAISPVGVWYGQEARMYAIFMFLAAVSTLAQVRALRRGARRDWVLFTLAAALLVYTQYFAVFFVGTQHLVFLIEVIRRRRGNDPRPLLKPWLMSLGVQALLVAPLVPFAAHQFANNQRAGLGLTPSAATTGGSTVLPRPSAYTALTNVVWTLWGYQPDAVTTRLVALWPLGLFAILVLLGRRRRPANRYLAFLALLPATAIFGFSFIASKTRSLAEIRYFAGTAPLAMVLVAAAITTVATKARPRALLTAGVAATMLVALAVQTFDHANPRLYQYREGIEQIAQEARPGDRVVYNPFYLDYTMTYYSPRVPATPLDKGLPKAPEGRIFLVDSAVFADTSESATDQAIRQLSKTRDLVSVRRYRQMTVWEFS